MDGVRWRRRRPPPRILSRAPKRATARTTTGVTQLDVLRPLLVPSPIAPRRTTGSTAPLVVAVEPGTSVTIDVGGGRALPYTAPADLAKTHPRVRRRARTEDLGGPRRRRLRCAAARRPDTRPRRVGGSDGGFQDTGLSAAGSRTTRFSSSSSDARRTMPACSRCAADGVPPLLPPVSLSPPSIKPPPPPLPRHRPAPPSR